MKTCFHAHTTYCKHSTNVLDELVQLAIEKGFSHFGISEHMPIPTNPMRDFSQTEFAQFINEYQRAKIKYGQQIKLYLGLECEYSPDLVDLVKHYFDMPEIDYLIFGNHFYGDNTHTFHALNSVAPAIYLQNQYDNAKLALSSRLFSCYNHPDIFLRSYRHWDELAINLTDQLIALSIEYNVPLEFNINGLYEKDFSNNPFQYPCEDFWRHVAKSNALVIIGVDTHEYKLLDDSYWNRSHDMIKQWGLEKNLIQMIEFKK